MRSEIELDLAGTIDRRVDRIRCLLDVIPWPAPRALLPSSPLSGSTSPHDDDAALCAVKRSKLFGFFVYARDRQQGAFGNVRDTARIKAEGRGRLSNWRLQLGQLPLSDCPEKSPKRTVPPRLIAYIKHRRRGYLTVKEVGLLMETARERGRYGHRDATMILVAYRHGLRAGEVSRWHVSTQGMRRRR